jgi:nucleotide-binding universal stress UspA family protein
MTIVYGYDFSETATEGALGAAALASCLKAPFLLAFVVDPKLRSLPPDLQAKLDAAMQARLDALAGQLRAEYPGLDARAVQLQGDPVDELNGLAARQSSPLLVLASGGQSDPRPDIGSVSGRIVQSAKVPVLVLRESSPWQDWAARRRPLRAILGVSRDASCAAAVETASQLRTAAPCDVIATEVYLSQELATHYGLGAAQPPYGVIPDPELGELVERDLTKRISGLRGSGDVRVRSRLSVGRTADHLLDVAERERADVVILGRHSQIGLFRPASVSDAVLQHGGMSVLIVPASARESRSDDLPQFRRVLAATDLSSFGNEAVRFALALAHATGGDLHLLHVSDAQVPDWDDEASLTAQLRSLVPQRWPFRVSTEVIFGRQPSTAIAGAAERMDADVICVASHGRRGLARVALGSVTEDLMRRAHRPVLVVRPAEE